MADKSDYIAKLIPGFLFLIFCSSCMESDKIKPESSGQSGSIVIVLSEEVYNSTIADSLISIMNTEVDALPQFESQFDVTMIREREFSHLFQLHRNIITVHIDEELKNSDPELALKSDIWSKPQIVARLRGADTTSIKNTIRAYAIPLLKAFNEAERSRIIADYKTITQKEILDKLNQDFGLEMAVPKTFKPAMHEKDFLWVRREERDYEQGLFIYRRNYVDTRELGIESIISFRDSVTRKYIPGPSEGSYMTSEKRLPVTHDTISIAGHYGILTRGLWRTEGDFMGGPFINYTFYHESDGKLVSIDGYVYAPKYDKREKVRQLEAIIYSLGN